MGWIYLDPYREQFWVLMKKSREPVLAIQVWESLE
jgi:hypothetical protein